MPAEAKMIQPCQLARPQVVAQLDEPLDYETQPYKITWLDDPTISTKFGYMWITSFPHIPNHSISFPHITWAQCSRHGAARILIANPPSGTTPEMKTRKRFQHRQNSSVDLLR